MLTIGLVSTNIERANASSSKRVRGDLARPAVSGMWARAQVRHVMLHTRYGDGLPDDEIAATHLHALVRKG